MNTTSPIVIRSTARYMTLGPNSTSATDTKVRPVHIQSGPGPSGPNSSALSAAPEIRAQPGRNRVTKPTNSRA